MKTTLKILIILISSLITGCEDLTEEHSILVQANDIIASYTKNNLLCSSVEDAIPYPDPWTLTDAQNLTIDETILKNTSTCGLIQTFINQPWNVIGPWCTHCSDLKMNGIEYFNNQINNNGVISELFSREDALYFLIGKYVSIIQDLKAWEKHPGYLYSFEMLLASGKMNEILNDTACKELMVLAMKMLDQKKGSDELGTDSSFGITRHILVNIFLMKQYEPFLSAYAVDGSIETCISGYNVCYSDTKKIDDFVRNVFEEFNN
jgi:hypothetical protein